MDEDDDEDMEEEEEEEGCSIKQRRGPSTKRRSRGDLSHGGGLRGSRTNCKGHWSKDEVSAKIFHK